jgi:anti-sigma regulatory factor (Ser/Thr protein kinase)
MNITYKEKTESMLNGEYFNLMNKRKRDQKYCHKKVIIDYIFEPHQIVYRITDEGRGFDHKAIMSILPENTNNQMLSHGRGIQLARKIFDLMTYNRAGNQVLLVKYLQHQS